MAPDIQEESVEQGPRSPAQGLMKPLVEAMRSDRLGSGQIGELRRLDPDRRCEGPDRRGEGAMAALWHVVHQYVEPAGFSVDVERLDSWMVILSYVAQLYDLPCECSFGSAVRAARVSEMRLERLLRTHDREMIWQLRGIVHQLRSAGSGCDLSELADLILADAHRNRSEGARRLDVILRRKIADAYYRTESTSKTKTDSNSNSDA